MKVILNKDLSPLGEEGDVKDVAKGYARNFLFPRGIALPYNERTIKLFESRKEEIENKKIQKRGDAASLKEKFEALELEISMPAGPNGKLYGAVTSQTIADELAKHGYQVERKKIDISGTSIKNIGKYKAIVKLYETSVAEVSITIVGQEIKTESRKAPTKPLRRRRFSNDGSEQEVDSQEASTEAQTETAQTEAPAQNEAPANTDTVSEPTTQAESTSPENTTSEGSSAETSSEA